MIRTKARRCPDSRCTHPVSSLRAEFSCLPMPCPLLILSPNHRTQNQEVCRPRAGAADFLVGHHLCHPVVQNNVHRCCQVHAAVRLHVLCSSNTVRFFLDCTAANAVSIFTDIGFVESAKFFSIELAGNSKTAQTNFHVVLLKLNPD